MYSYGMARFTSIGISSRVGRRVYLHTYIHKHTHRHKLLPFVASRIYRLLPKLSKDSWFQKAQTDSLQARDLMKYVIDLWLYIYGHFQNHKTNHRISIIIHTACLVFNAVSDVPVCDVVCQLMFLLHAVTVITSCCLKNTTMTSFRSTIRGHYVLCNKNTTS